MINIVDNRRFSTPVHKLFSTSTSTLTNLTFFLSYFLFSFISHYLSSFACFLSHNNFHRFSSHCGYYLDYLLFTRSNLIPYIMTPDQISDPYQVALVKEFGKAIRSPITVIFSSFTPLPNTLLTIFPPLGPGLYTYSHEVNPRDRNSKSCSCPLYVFHKFIQFKPFSCSYQADKLQCP